MVMFDCDGVLVNSELIACEVLAGLITRLGYPISRDETVARFLGRSQKDARAQIETMIGRPLGPHEGEAEADILLDRFRTELLPVDGVREAILAIPGQRCVASSSSPGRLRLSLELTGLLPLFEPRVFSATQVALGKPSPDLFLFAAASCRVAPEACLVVEDSPAGVTAARAAGMPAIGFIGASHATPALGERLRAAGAATVIEAMSALPAAVAALRTSLPRSGGDVGAADRGGGV